MTKNLLAAITALILFITVLCVKGVAEPSNKLSESEIHTLMVSMCDVIQFVEGKPPVQRITFFIDGKRDTLTIHIKVDSSTSAEKCRDIEQELKRELLHAVIDNEYLKESTEILSKLNVKMELKKAPEMGVIF